jgi:hypothetical protein
MGKAYETSSRRQADDEVYFLPRWGESDSGRREPREEVSCGFGVALGSIRVRSPTFEAAGWARAGSRSAAAVWAAQR